MKRKTITFMIALIISMLILPALNIKYNPDTFSQDKVRDKVSSLYNMDIIETGVGYIGYKLGVSIAPEEAYVGKNGWLFLGEHHSHSITTKLSGLTSPKIKAITNIAKNINSWDDFFKSQGVKDFKIVIGPDKESIYKEFTPSWFKQSDYPILPALIRSNKKVYVDVYAPLTNIKTSSKLPLYFETDTHWNLYGGAVAFNALAKTLKSSVPGIKLDNEFTEPDFFIKQKAGGDLSRFLKISKILQDNEVDIARREFNDMSVTSFDYHTGKTLSVGKFSLIEAPQRLTVFKSTKALNNYRVLWLRDSFGTAMSPYMVRTFANILQVHYNKIMPGEMKTLILDYKPDFVFITSVERDSLSPFFSSPM
ncbi:hypothetical protein ACLE0G_000764 [Cronobacter turicensis]